MNHNRIDPYTCDGRYCECPSCGYREVGRRTACPECDDDLRNIAVPRE